MACIVSAMVPDEPDWLPELVLLEDYGGDWHTYVEAIYALFRAEYVEEAVQFQGLRVTVKRHPEISGKCATFWHLVSEGEIEAERLPDLRRCERILWTRSIIENSSGTYVKVWENTRRGGERRICLWLEDTEYLVVLACRNGYYLLWTAYCVTQTRQKKRLEREYEAWNKADAAP